MYFDLTSCAFFFFHVHSHLKNAFFFFATKRILWGMRADSPHTTGASFDFSFAALVHPVTLLFFFFVRAEVATTALHKRDFQQF